MEALSVHSGHCRAMRSRIRGLTLILGGMDVAQVSSYRSDQGGSSAPGLVHTPGQWRSPNAGRRYEIGHFSAGRRPPGPDYVGRREMYECMYVCMYACMQVCIHIVQSVHVHMPIMIYMSTRGDIGNTRNAHYRTYQLHQHPVIDQSRPFCFRSRCLWRFHRDRRGPISRVFCGRALYAVTAENRKLSLSQSRQRLGDYVRRGQMEGSDV